MLSPFFTILQPHDQVPVGHIQISPFPHVGHQVGHDVAEGVVRAKDQVDEKSSDHGQDSTDREPRILVRQLFGAHFFFFWFKSISHLSVLRAN